MATNLSKQADGQARLRTSRMARGFTLIELLTVMAIIAILISLGAVGINNIGEGQGVTAGLSQAEGLLAQTRRLAMNQNAPARLVIHGDLNDSSPIERERYRRMMMVMYKETDDEGRILPEWKRFGTPTFLPGGVYYAAELSRADMRSGGVLPTDQHQLTGQAGDSRLCHYYEFNGQGVCTTPGAGFILESGTRPPGQQRPLQGGRRDVGGFVILKTGATTYIRDIERLGVIATQ